MTEKEARRRAFLEDRRKGIGGSDLGALCNVHPYGKTPLDLWREKVEPVPEVLPPATGPQARGIAMEPLIADQYEEETGYELVPCPKLADPAKPYLTARPDRLVMGERAFVEIKAPSQHVFSRLKNEGITEQYQLQAQDYFMVIGRVAGSMEWADFRFFNAEWWTGISVRVYPDERIQKAVEELADHFWHDHVLAQVPPPAEGYSIDVPVNNVALERIDDDPEKLVRLQMYLDARSTKKLAEENFEMAKAELLQCLPGLGSYEAAGDGPGLVHRLTYREQKGRKTLDAGLLRGRGLLDPIAVSMVVQRQVTRGLISEAEAQDWLLNLRSARVDLEDFYRQGDPYYALRAYPNAKER